MNASQPLHIPRRGREKGKKHNWVMPFLLGSPVFETDFNGSGKGVLSVRLYRADFLGGFSVWFFSSVWRKFSSAMPEKLYVISVEFSSFLCAPV